MLPYETKRAPPDAFFWEAEVPWESCISDCVCCMEWGCSRGCEAASIGVGMDVGVGESPIGGMEGVVRLIEVDELSWRSRSCNNTRDCLMIWT